jgi:hypothetical protein
MLLRFNHSWVAAALLFVLLLPSAIAGPVEIAEHLKRATVQITVESDDESGLGSGYFITPTLIVTNLHVVEGHETVSITSGRDDSDAFEGRVISTDRAADLAIIRSARTNANHLRIFASGLPRVGERIFTLGNPVGEVGTFSDGVISNIRAHEGIDSLYFTAPISSGSSGSAIVDAQGVLLGTVSASLRNAQNINLAVPTKYLIRALLPLGYRLTELGFSSEQERSLVGDCSFITPEIPLQFEVMPKQESAKLVSSISAITHFGERSTRAPFLYRDDEGTQLVFGHEPLHGAPFSGRTEKDLKAWVSRDFMLKFRDADRGPWPNLEFELAWDHGVPQPILLSATNAETRAISAFYLFPYCRFWSYERFPGKVEASSLISTNPIFLSQSRELFRLANNLKDRSSFAANTEISLSPKTGKAPWTLSLLVASPLLLGAILQYKRGRGWLGILLVMLASGTIKAAVRHSSHPADQTRGTDRYAEETPIIRHVPPELLEALMGALQEGESEGADLADPLAEAPSSEEAVQPSAELSSVANGASRALIFRGYNKDPAGFVRVRFLMEGREFQHCSPDCGSFSVLPDGYAFVWDETRGEISFVDSVGNRFSCALIACPETTE